MEKMKEKKLNKVALILIGITICFSAIIFPGYIVFAFTGYTFNWIALIITIVIDLIIMLLCARKLYKSFPKEIMKFVYNDMMFKYIVKQEEKLVVFIDNIEEIYCKQEEDNGTYLYVRLKDMRLLVEPMMKRYIKKLSKIINREIKIEKYKKCNPIKSKTKMSEKEKRIIIGTIIGAFISVGSMLLYFNNKGIIWLSVILSVISFAGIYTQLYFLYFGEKEYGIAGNIIICFIAVLACLLVFFIVVIIVTMVLAKLPFSIDYLFVSIFLMPSFLVVICIILFFMFCLSYA